MNKNVRKMMTPRQKQRRELHHRLNIRHQSNLKRIKFERIQKLEHGYVEH